MRKRNIRGRRWRSIIALAIVAAVFILLYAGGLWLERRSEKPETRGDYRQRYAYDALTDFDGAPYRQRKDLTTILLMGIDHESDASRSDNRHGGQADFLRLIVIDTTNRKVSQIEIDRDTMTPIVTLGVLGNRSGVRTAQISLSHGFGDGGEASCELTVEAVSNLLCQAPVDFYIAMNLDGIPVLNDSVGGVTVTLADDFSALDPSMTPGRTLTLVGDQAEIYVRSRTTIDANTNEARMARQEQYVSQLMAQLDGRMRQDGAFMGGLYDQLQPYLTTNLSRGRLINEALLAKDYDREETIQLKGTHEMGENGFMQFIIDEEALRQTVKGLFYEPVE